MRRPRRPRGTFFGFHGKKRKTGVDMSSGKHTELQAAILDAFAKRFAPGSLLLYLGATAKKSLVVAEATLSKLGIPMTKADQLPDMMLYVEERNRLFLIEAVTSHGPISPARRSELERELSGCTAERIYISAFRNFQELKRNAEDIAWKTEVWIAESPDHMIHFNGGKFLGSPVR